MNDQSRGFHEYSIAAIQSTDRDHTCPSARQLLDGIGGISAPVLVYSLIVKRRHLEDAVGHVCHGDN
jgi:hypothetical protein